MPENIPAVVDQTKVPAKRGRGRPRKYETPEALDAAVMEYFDELDKINARLEEQGKDIIPPTSARLCIHLGFSSVNSLYTLEKDGGGFLEVVKKARLFIRDYHEMRVAGSKMDYSLAWLRKNAPKEWGEQEGEGGISVNGKEITLNVQMNFGDTSTAEE